MAAPGVGEAAVRVLVAGIGNVLRGDDGFGPAVIAALRRTDLPEGVTLLDAGIGGFSLVRELLDGYDALVIVDAVDRGLPPGTVRVLEPSVPGVDALPPESRAGAAGDMHNAVPGVALVIAKAAGALPPLVRIVGCQPHDVDTCTTMLSDAVRRAIPLAAAAVREVIAAAPSARALDAGS